MAAIRNLANLRRKQVTATNLGTSLDFSRFLGINDGEIDIRDSYDGYVWKCISTRSQAVSQVELVIERSVGGQWQPAPNHDYKRFLEGSDGGLTDYELIEATQTYKDMFGEAFWYISVKENSRTPVDRVILDPDKMTVVVDGHRRIKGYVYNRPDGGKVPLELDEVEHFRYFNPNEPLRGLGPMQAAGWFIKTERYASKYVANFLDNNATPPGILVIKSKVDEGDWKTFKNEWKRQNAGIDNAGKMGFLKNTEADYIKTGMSLDDIDIEKLKHVTRDDIMAMFSISKPIIGLFDDINRASSLTARTLLAETITIPNIKSIVAVLDRRVKKAYGQNFRLSYVDPTPKDPDQVLDETKEGVNKWLTINEARETYNLPPLPDGDTIKLPINLVDATGPLKKSLTVKVKSVKKKTIHETKENFRLTAEKLQDKHIESFLEKFDELLEEQKKEVKENFLPKKNVRSRLFDSNTWATRQSELTISILINLVQEQGNQASEFVGGEAFVLSQEHERHLRESLFNGFTGFNEDTLDELAKTLTEGLNNGESIRQLTERIDGAYDTYWRRERLARTEIIDASNEANIEAWKQTGFVTKKEWFANPGACVYCEELSGSIVSLEATFIPKGGEMTGTDGSTRIVDYKDVDHPPAHSNCRCTTLAVIGDD